MDTVSISNLASTTSIRPQIKSSADEGLNLKFAEDFSHLSSKNADVQEAKPLDPPPENQTFVLNDVDSFSNLLNQANTAFKQQGANLMFEIDKDSSRPILLIKDSETKEIIRQVPSDSYLDMSRKITDYLERSAAGGQSNAFVPAVGLLTSEVA